MTDFTAKECLNCAFLRHSMLAQNHVLV